MNDQLSNIDNHNVLLDEDKIDLVTNFRIIYYHKWSIIGFAIFITFLTSLYVSSLVPIYEATVTILIETQEDNIIAIEEVYATPNSFRNREYFETQNQILKSRLLAEKVIDALNIPKHPDFDPDIRKPAGLVQTVFSWFRKNSTDDEKVTPPDYIVRNGIVGKFRGNLRVAPIPDSQLIKVTFASRDPELSAVVPNKLANIYIYSNLKNRLDMTKGRQVH